MVEKTQLMCITGHCSGTPPAYRGTPTTAPVLGTTSFEIVAGGWKLRRQVLPTSRPGALLLCLLSPSCFLQQRLVSSPPTPLPFWRHAFVLRGAPSSFSPSSHEPFGCFQDPPVPLDCLFCCTHPQHSFHSKLPWGVLRGAFDR